MRPLLLVFPLSLIAACSSSEASHETHTSAEAQSGAGAVVGMPFDGYFNRFAGTGDDTSPYIHHRVVGGDWATDIYAAPGTPVVFHVRGAAARVASLYAACAGAGPDLGGYQAQIDLTDPSSGAPLGSVFFLHLASPPIAAGQSIGDGTVLGYTRLWAQSGCYAVSNANGVHTHFEARSAVGSSCFTTTGGANVLGEGAAIARLGAGDAFGVCPGDVGGPHDPCAGKYDSQYCGEHGLGLDTGTLYVCKGGALQGYARPCQAGCVQVSGADPDYCQEDTTQGCSCDGIRVDDTPVSTQTCGASVCGLDHQLWYCGATGFAGGGGGC